MIFLYDEAPAPTGTASIRSRLGRDVRAHHELACVAEAAEILLKPDGRFFRHIFTHRSSPYGFEPSDRQDWTAHQFIPGGVMPSHHLIRQYADLFTVGKEWRWSGTHYHRTTQDWLANFDVHHDAIEKILREVYGEETGLWMRRWRWSFLATAGLFGYADGSEWGVSQSRMRAA
jgi:cyclopropane-fatty-acyl-phospholipid synthase